MSSGDFSRAFLRRAHQLSSVQSRGPGAYWVEHKRLNSDDAGLLADARHLTLWNVKTPEGFFDALEHLEFLDIRGGSGTTLAPLAKLNLLRGLVINQVRGLTDVAALSGLTSLEILSLYGLAHIERLPSLRALSQLRRVELGQMRALSDLRGLADAPALEEVLLIRRLAIDGDAVQPLAAHQTLRAFDWFWEDVPVWRARAVLEAMQAKEKTRAVRPEQWFAEQRAAEH